MCTWEHSSHCGNWVSVWCFPWGYQRKEWLYGAQPPFFSSPSPNPFSTISSHAGAKAAASSPLHPMCTRSVPQSGSWQSWQCHRHVPWRGIFGWLWSAACQGRSRDHHGAQSTLSCGAGEQSWGGYCALLPKWPAAASAMLCAIASFLTLLPLRITIYPALSISS